MAEKADFIRHEVENVRFLQGLASDPEAFLRAQNELLYERDLSHLQQQEDLGQRGLPAAASGAYPPSYSSLPSISERVPRVLNIGAGPEVSQKMPAVNLDVSADGRPEVMADATQLPFADGSFSVVRASHVLEHIPQDKIKATLHEWRRVLHKDGLLYI